MRRKELGWPPLAASEVTSTGPAPPASLSSPLLPRQVLSSSPALSSKSKMPFTYSVEQISGPMGCGEGPHWDASRRLLFFVDIPRSLIFSFDPASRSLVQAKVDAPTVSFILPVKGSLDKFVVGLGLSLAIITWDGVSTTVPKEDIEILHSVEAGRKNNRFNDGKTDPTGRVFAGTMDTIATGPSKEAGALYSLGPDRRLLTKLKDVTIGNGLAWTEDRSVFYYIDSLAYTIDAFDYDVATGGIANRRVVFDVKKNGLEGVADGMTIDRDGNLWVALYGGNHVVQVDPRTGKLIRKLQMPCRDITSVAFIGPHLDQLVVTSAYQHLPAGETDLNPQAGCTFIVSGLGVHGYQGVDAVV